MASLIVTLARSVFGPRPDIICEDAVWIEGVKELRRRAAGKRESGAFLLGTQGKCRKVKEFIFYDDIDPRALKSGIVVIDGRHLGKLWKLCREKGQRVVADIHVHPGGFQQSYSDRANPIIAETNHIAFILPNYATGAARPGEIGIYRYLGARKWKDHSCDKYSPLHLGWWPKCL